MVLPRFSVQRKDVAAGLAGGTADAVAAAVGEGDASPVAADDPPTVGVADTGDEPGPRVAPPSEAPGEEAAVAVAGAAAHPPASVATRSAARKAGRIRTVALRSRCVAVVTAASLRS